MKIYNKAIRDINQFRNDPTNFKYWKNLAIAVYVEPHQRKVDDSKTEEKKKKRMKKKEKNIKEGI